MAALEAQLRVLVQAHAPQLGHVLGRGGDESEAVTTSSRGDLRRRGAAGQFSLIKPLSSNLIRSILIMLMGSYMQKTCLTHGKITQTATDCDFI